MKLHTLALTALALLMGVPVAAAQGLQAGDAFASAPASVFPLLDRNARLDMLDYYNNNMTTPTANNLDGRSAITSMTPSDITVRLTDSSTAQLVLLNAGSDTIMAVISTVATPGLDSSISFYDSAWRPLDTAAYFTKPGWKDWLNPGGDLATVTAMTPFMLASYVYDPATSSLTLTNNLGKFMDPDLYETISPSLRPTLTYTWTGKKFAKK